MTNKKPKLANYKVGLTILLGLIIFFAFILLVGTEEYLFSKTYQIKMISSNVEGLNDGSMVSLGGLKIGSVDGINFINKDGKNFIEISLKVQSKYQNQITENSTASIKTLGLLGDKFVDIVMGQPDQKQIADGGYIQLERSLSFENLTEKIDPAIDQLSKLISNLNDVTDSIKNGDGLLSKLFTDKKTARQFTASIQELSAFVNSLNHGDGTIHKLVYDKNLSNDLSEVIGDLKSITKSVHNGNGTLGKLVNNDSLYLNLNELTDNLKRASNSFNDDSTFVGGLLNDGDGYKKFISLLNELNKLVTDIKENPGNYVNLSLF